MPIARITSPDDPALDALLARLAELSSELDAPDSWPAEQLRLCGESGVFEWFIEPEVGGQGWSEADLLRAYVQLAAACLTTTFVITQRTGAMTRIAAGESQFARDVILPDLIAGRSFATVGISHLTTSRQHLARPVMRAAEHGESIVLDGYSPWVTGAEFAQHVVLGATLDDGRQILVALPTNLPGVRTERAPQLVGLSGSRTGPIICTQVAVPLNWLLAGPVREVMKQGLGAKTGGLQTSALALGLSTAAIKYLREQAEPRPDLAEPVEALNAERDKLYAAMLHLARDAMPNESAIDCVANANELRQRANSLALRAAQSALAAAKGAGYVAGHSAGRWCREALFFLVWSCPQPVMQANLCELAGITE
jgi:alkylation response protein AidB-like acyl-CoA dehydrogenase